MAKILLLVLVLVSLIGCSSLSKRNCEEGNWKTLGVEDGKNGTKLAKIDTYIKECKSYGLTVDESAYKAGRDEGLKIFCQPEHGFLIGKLSQEYPRVCPGHLEAAFLQKYQLGRQIAQQKYELSLMHGRITSLEGEIDRSQDENEKRNLRNRLQELQREQSERQRNISIMEAKGE